jgi:hypothetical protein
MFVLGIEIDYEWEQLSSRTTNFVNQLHNLNTLGWHNTRTTVMKHFLKSTQFWNKSSLF